MAEKKKIAMLSNITVDLIAGKLRRKFDFYIPEGFDTWVQEVINPAARLYSEKVDAVIILLDGTEARSWKNTDEAIERFELWKQAINILSDKISTIPIFITTIDIRENRIKSLSERMYRLELENDWYQFVQSKVDESRNVYVVDVADIIADIGRNQFYSNKMWYMSSMPYSRDGLNAVVKGIEMALSSTFETRRKIIALDLDNTLWGGVVGEDGVEGIVLSDHKEGQRYYDFQHQLLEMKKRGIVLGVLSKNNEEDAEAAIQGHPAMLLRDDDFVVRKINWENKAVNLTAMERELNLTEGGFIFIDDNPVERETIKGECPECLVPEFPIDTTELLSFAENIWFNYCRPLRVLGEDVERTRMYQNEAKRKQERESSLNLDDYLKKLEMTVDIHRMRPEEKERVVQLINKTNQFNVTTKRYTAAEIDTIETDESNSIYVVHSLDKYGDNGLVCVVILKESEGDIEIDTFLMSCRVMGRKLEELIMNELAAMCQKKIRAEYIPTAKNAPVNDLFDRLGFVLISNHDGHKVYELDAVVYQPQKFDYYKEIRFEA